ncbi:MAG: PQQ-binding-like beta-propeller repeat protein [bacterium]
MKKVSCFRPRSLFFSVYSYPLCSLLLVILVFFGTFMYAPAVSSAQSGGLANSAWPCLGHDVRHTGQSPYLGAQTNTLKWSYQTGSGVWSSPAIGVDGTMYIGISYGETGEVFALDPNGSKKWSYQTIGGGVVSSPAIGADGTIYVGSLDHNLYALNPNGSKKWSYLTGNGIDSSPVIGADGTIYVGGLYDKFYVLDPNGNVRWSYPLEIGLTWSSPAIGADGTIYIVGSDSNLTALDPNGSLKWSYYLAGNETVSSPALGADGTIYVARSYGEGGDLYAVDPNGVLKWDHFLDGYGTFSSLAIGTDGTMYIGMSGNNLAALDPNGNPKWSYQTGGEIVSAPAIGADGTVYFGSSLSQSGEVIALDPNGSLKWSYQTGGIVSSPAIGADGTVYIASSDGSVYAFAGKVATPSLSPVSGSFTESITVSISCDTPDVTIHYTTDESEPDENSPVYTAPIQLTGTATIEARGFKSGWIPSDTAIEIYTYTPAPEKVATPSLSPVSGSFTESITVSISCDTPDVTIHYTTDGSEPDENSEVYTAPLVLNDTTTIAARGFKSEWIPSDTATETYTRLEPEGGLANSAWPCRGHDARHTGQSPYSGAQVNTLQWKFKTEGPVESSAAIGVDGTIYIGSDDQRIYAIHPDGNLQWSCQTGGEVCSSPAIGADGTVYAGSNDGRIYALRPENGSLRWIFPPAVISDTASDSQPMNTDMDDVFSSPALGADGTIYVGSESGRIYAIDPNGTMKWNYQAQGEVYSSPAIGNDDSTLYVGSTGGIVYALKSGIDLDPATRLKWKFQVNGGFYSSPAIGNDGTVYIGSSNNSIYALDPNGSLKWSYRTCGDIDSSPAIGADGTVYVGSDNGSVYALDPGATDPNDRVKWRYQTEGSVWSSPAIGADGTVYIGSNDGWIYALSPQNGNLKWRYQTGGRVASSAAIKNGLIYIGSSDGLVYALGAETPEEDISMYKDDQIPGKSGSSGGGCFINSVRGGCFSSSVRRYLNLMAGLVITCRGRQNE